MSWWSSRIAGSILPSIVVAVVVFQLIRSHVCERYRVTSRSMEPALHGHPETGDVVLVDRTAWWFEDPVPGDLVVLRNRDDETQNHLVKRLIAVGPAFVEFRDGDVFVGETRQTLRRLVKDPTAERGLRTRFASYPTEAPDFLRPDAVRWSVGADSIELRPVADPAALRSAVSVEAQDRRVFASPPDHYVPGHLSLAGPVGNEFLDARGERQSGLGPLPRDVGFELDIELAEATESLHLVHEYAETYHAVEIERDGRLTLTVYENRLATTRIDPLPIRSRFALGFGFLDGRIYVTVDDAIVFERPVDLPTQSRLLIDRTDRFLNQLHLGIAGTGPAQIRRFEVFRDPHYDAAARSFHVELGQVFVLGDNAYDSADSRDRPGDPFERTDLLGRPFAVIGPAERARWLPSYSLPSP